MATTKRSPVAESFMTMYMRSLSTTACLHVRRHTENIRAAARTGLYVRERPSLRRAHLLAPTHTTPRGAALTFGPKVCVAAGKIWPVAGLTCAAIAAQLGAGAAALTLTRPGAFL
jgi:hypothetical protein